MDKNQRKRPTKTIKKKDWKANWLAVNNASTESQRQDNSIRCTWWKSYYVMFDDILIWMLMGNVTLKLVRID